MPLLTAILAILVASAILYDIARRIGVPYPTSLVIGGLGLAFVPGLPKIALEPALVLLVFLPPLLFKAAVETPKREELRMEGYGLGRIQREAIANPRCSRWRPPGQGVMA